MTGQLDRLFNPSSVTIVGASKDVRKSGGRFLAGLINSTFEGELYPVNPGESEIMGLRSYPRVQDIPAEIDLAFVTVPARIVPQVIGDCSQKGVKFAVVHSAGFSELGAEGKELEEEMLEFARQGVTRIIGPNCMGIYCPQAGINTIAVAPATEEAAGAVAFVSQSGWVTENVMVMGYERGLRFSKVVSIGNQSDLTFVDLLRYFAGDTSTKVIVFHMEGIKQGEELIQLAGQVSREKPVIVWKAGRTASGVGAAASHSGSPSGNSEVFESRLIKSGVAIAQNLEELIDLTLGFTCPILPAGNRVALLVEAGGAAVAGADVADELGLDISTLSPETQGELANKLEGLIPPFSTPKNPVDLVWVPDNDRARIYLECTRLMLKDTDVAVVLAYNDLDGYFATEMANLQANTAKPIFIIPGHPTEQRVGMSLLTQNGIPTFAIPERALRTLAAMLRYSNYLRFG